MNLLGIFQTATVFMMPLMVKNVEERSNAAPRREIMCAGERCWGEWRSGGRMSPKSALERPPIKDTTSPKEGMAAAVLKMASTRTSRVSVRVAGACMTPSPLVIA